MKSSLFTAILVLTVITISAQPTISETEKPPSVENSIFSIEAGPSEYALLGLWAGYEQRLGSRFTFKTEVGINMLPIFHPGNDGAQFDMSFQPALTIEPRYYLIERRAAKGKDISNNSGTYFGLQTTYSPVIFKYPGESQSSIQNTRISIVPSVGMRRNIGKKFFMEGAIGLGVGYHRLQHPHSNDFSENFMRHVNLHLRVGYRF